MKLLFKQRFFSWLDKFDIYDEKGNIIFVVKKLSPFRRSFKIYDANSNEVGMIIKKMFTPLRPRFNLVINGNQTGNIVKELSFFKPKFTLDFRNWRIEGNWLSWNYRIQSTAGTVATINRSVLSLTDNYEIEVNDSEDVLATLMVVIAIDAIKCIGNK